MVQRWPSRSRQEKLRSPYSSSLTGIKISAPAFFCSFVNEIGFRHDEVNRLRCSSVDFVRLFDKASPLVVAHRAEHHHSITRAQLRVSNTPAIVRYNKIFLESKNAAKPFNHRRRVPIAKAGYNRSRHPMTVHAFIAGSIARERTLTP